MNTTSTLDPQTIELLESLSEHIDVAALAQTLSRLPAGKVSTLLRSISKPPRTPVVPPVNGDFYDLDASLTPEQRRVRDGVRAFME
ncbi:MAG: acyl-CoA dehydrogenase, partial [Bacteroidota bacterium]